MGDRDNRYPLAWPSGWKRHQPSQRKRAPFGVRRQVQGYSWKSLQPVSVENAVDQLDAELRRLGARDFVLSSDLKLRNDGWPRSGQPEPADPGVAVYFRLGGQPRCLACDRWTRTADNIVALARHVDAIPGAAVVTADNPAGERARILDNFKAGRTRVVANVGVLAIGFDFPALEAVVLARPTASLAVYYQQVGRAIRPAPDKRNALVLDLVGLVDQFGPVEDMVLERGGKRGDLWVVRSRGRDLTNVYFGDEAQQRKRQQQARYFGGGRRYGRRAALHQAADDLF